MFNLFKKKKPQNLMSELASTMYGPGAKTGQSELMKATQYAFSNLLGEVVPQSEVATIAQDLRSGEIPYSTEDLALATALNFFRRDDLKTSLSFVQLQARMQMLDWLQKGCVNPMLVQVFENTLYKRFMPSGPGLVIIE